tara:strand:+ start:4254 stop:4757 length:504 start_codon:yes stop_codon:yes gene_type:complete
VIALNLSDTVKASMIFNHLLKTGAVAILTECMATLDPRYTKNVDRVQVASFIRDFQREFYTEVELYRSRNPWSNAYASTYTGNYNLIKLNRRKLNRSIESICGSIAHEWGHCLEYYMKTRFPVIEFNHGSNSPVDKDFTFQYQLGRAVKSHVGGLKHEILRDLRIDE